MHDPAAIYIGMLDSSNSIHSVTRAISRFARWMTGNPKATHIDVPWSELTFSKLQEYRQHLITEKKAPDTIATYLSYIKSIVRVAATVSDVSPDKRITHATLVEIAQRIKAPKRSGELANRFVPIDEFKMLLSNTDDGTTAGKRDRAIIHLMYGCGLRRSEVVGLEVKSIRWERQELEVIGKGNKTRYLPLFSDLEDSIESYLQVRGEHAGPLFHRISRADRLVTTSALTSQGLVNIVNRRCTKAGLERYNAHSFRASFATLHFTIGTDLFTIQKLMGHSSPTTTQRYDVRDKQAGAQAMDKLGAHIRESRLPFYKSTSLVVGG